MLGSVLSTSARQILTPCRSTPALPLPPHATTIRRLCRLPPHATTIRRLCRLPPVGIKFHNQRINYLFKSGLLVEAMQLFSEMPERDVVTWNTVIAGHTCLGFPELAAEYYRQMVSRGVVESPTTFSSILGVCGDSGFHRLGLQAHCRVVFLGHQANFFTGSVLVNFYMSVGWPDPAMRMFGELQETSTAICNSVLRGFLEMGMLEEMIRFFLHMKYKPVDANGLSLSYLLRGCCDGRLLEEGTQIHCQAIKLGFADSYVFVSNALVDLYSEHGSLIDTRKAIESIPIIDIISWNSVVAVNANHGHLLEALEYFHMMLKLGMNASVRSILGLLNLASRTRNAFLGFQIHGFAIKSGHVHGSAHVKSALIDAYGKCGKIRRSIVMFDEVKMKGLGCFNSMITSLLHCNAPEDAIEMWKIASDEGVRPDHVTFSATLRAISNSVFASLTSCEVLHCLVIKSGFETEMVVSSSLISTYAKCGHVDVSTQIFKHIQLPNIVCFTALIAGYAQNGRGKECIEMLNDMVCRDLKPDAVTLLSILAGCNHSGLVDEGYFVFESMEVIYGIKPDQRHYTCMVGLLGRAGLVEEAFWLTNVAPEKNNSAMWNSLLQSCRAHGNNEVGRRAAEVLMQLEPTSSATCLQVSQFYSVIADQRNSDSVRERMRVMERRKDVGHSLVEVNDWCLIGS